MWRPGREHSPKPQPSDRPENYDQDIVYDTGEGVCVHNGLKAFALKFDVNERCYDIDRSKTSPPPKCDPRPAKTLSELILVEYSKVFKKVSEVGDEAKSTWARSYVKHLAKLKWLTKLLNSRTENPTEIHDPMRWFNGGSYRQHEVILCEWKIHSETHLFLMKIEKQFNGFSAWYKTHEGTFGFQEHIQEPEIKRRAEISLTEVIVKLSKVTHFPSDIVNSNNVVAFQNILFEAYTKQFASKLAKVQEAEQMEVQVPHALRAAEQEKVALHRRIGVLEKEVSSFRMRAAEVAGGDSKNIANCVEGRLPSAGDVIEEARVVGKEFCELYMDLNIEGEAKSVFARTTIHMMKGMYEMVDSICKQRLQAMLTALGDIETLSTMTRSTMEGFHMYCQRYWTQLFSVGSENAVQNLLATPERISSVAGLANGDSQRVALKELESRPENDEDEVSKCMETSNDTEGAKLVSKAEVARDIDKVTPVGHFFDEFMKKLTDECKELAQRLLQENHKEELQEKIEEWWKLTVGLYLQQPALRLEFESDPCVEYSTNLYRYIFRAPKAGESVVLLVPMLMRAPEGFSAWSATAVGEGWTRISHGFVDGLED